jgi:hypothetical protein
MPMSLPSAATKPAKAKTDWTGSLTLIPSAIILAVFLYFDRQMHVTDAFPLKSHPTPPLTAFLLMGTLGFPPAPCCFLGHGSTTGARRKANPGRPSPAGY